MTSNRSRQFVTLILIFGAIVFGMILAGTLDLTWGAAPVPQQERHPAIVGRLPAGPQMELNQATARLTPLARRLSY